MIYEEIGKKYNVNDMDVFRWSLKYKENGIAAFQNINSTKSYTAEFKIKCIELYIIGQMSVNQIAAKFNVSYSQVFSTEKHWDIRWMCAQLGISRASYYKWLKRDIPAAKKE